MNNSVLAFERSNPVTFAGNISGSGSFNQNGTGTTVLTGMSSILAKRQWRPGTLQVDGVLGNTAVSVESAAMLSGHGTIAGP